MIKLAFLGTLKMNVKEAIEKRRSYRSLEPVEITKELIKDLAECAQMAPSCQNHQPWRFVFVYDHDLLQKLSATLQEGNRWVKKASMIIVVFSEVKLDCIIKERLYYLFDTGMAVGLMMLRATELGLVAHPIAGFEEPEAKKILDIPHEMRIITLLVVGKHSKEVNPDLTQLMKENERNRPSRIKLQEFVYLNKYKKTS